MKTVWTFLSPGARVPLLLCTFAAMLLSGYLTGHPPKHGKVVRIVHFELAMGTQESSDLLSRWSPQQTCDMKASIYYDFPFILSYVAFSALLCSALCASLARSFPGWAWFGERIAWGFVVAGALDVVEDAGLLLAIWKRSAAPWPQLAGLASIAKWSYIGFALLYALASTFLLCCAALFGHRPLAR